MRSSEAGANYKRSFEFFTNQSYSLLPLNITYDLRAVQEFIGDFLYHKMLYYK